MDCQDKDIDKIIIDFIDGELEYSEQALVEQHLAGCRYHREEVEALTATRDDFIKTLKPIAASYSPKPDAWERLTQRIAIEEQPSTARQSIKEMFVKASRRISGGTPTYRRFDWKAGLVGVLAIALIVVLSVTIPMLVGSDSKVLAIDIALNNPEVQAAVSDRLVEETGVVGTINKESVFVYLSIEDGSILIAEVNTETQQVVELYPLELTEEVKQRAIDIAITDARIQNLLEQGVDISGFTPSYYYEIHETIGLGGEIIKEGSIEFIIQLKIELDENLYFIFVNLDRGELIEFQGPINKTQFSTFN